jgi:putative ABC transport system permease protein
MFKSYIKIALRNLAKNKSASIINLTGLSLGMAAAVLILLWVQNEMNFDNYHPHASNIYYVDMGQSAGQQKFGGTPFPLAQALKKEVPGIEETTQFISGNGFNSPVLNINETFFKEKSLVYVDKNWFVFFHYDFISGNASSFNQNLNSIILTESLAKKYYGNKMAVGEIIHIDSGNYRVQGVIKDNPSNSSFQYNIFLPEEAYFKTRPGEAANWRNFPCETFIRTKENANAVSIQQGISSIIVREVQLNMGNTGRKDTLAGFITPLKKMHFEGAHFGTGGDKKIVTIFSVLGLLLLAIASINYVNLSTAKASKRSKEVSVKKIMGASSKSLFGQFMAESILTSVIALLLTFVIIKLALPWFNSLTEKTFRLSLASVAMWQVLCGTLILAIVLTGIYPALLFSSFKPLQVLRGNNMFSIKDSSLRKVLVTAQFTIAVALSFCTIVILQQLHFIQQNNEGYNRSQIFSFPIPNSFITNGYITNKTDVIRTLKNELNKETAIENTTVSNEGIQNITISMGGIIDWVGKKPGDEPSVSLLSVDADFRNMFKLQLSEGRWYDADNASDRHNYILTETTVAALGLKKPYIGQYFSVINDTGRIIGIVKDFHFRDYHQKITAAVLVASPDMKGTFFVQSAPLKMKQALASTESIFKKLFPHTPFEYKFMDAEFEKMYRADRKAAALISIFAGIAIFISCLGLFGLVSFVAEQRTKEIGIRKILGATVTNITALLSKDFLKLVMLSIVIASPIGWWAANKWLQEFAYRINISWWMFLVAGISAIVIALITLSFQAVKAAVVNPVSSLRTE